MLVSPLEPIRSTTIDELLDDPLITSIAIKRLRPIVGKNGNIDTNKTKQLHDDFRLAIANVISNNDNPSLKDRIYQLFGYPNGSQRVGVDVVNSVIRKIGRWAEVPKEEQQSKHQQRVPNGSTLSDRAEFIGCLGSSLNQRASSGQIHSYITPNTLFGDLCYVRLNTQQQSRIDQAMNEIVRIQEPYLGSIFSEFIHLLFTDEKFFEVVLKGFKEGKIRDQELQHTLTQALQCSSESRIADLTWISRSIARGEVPLRDLQDLMKNANEDHQALVEWFASLGAEIGPNAVSIPIPSPETDTKVWIRTGKNSINDTHLNSSIQQLYQLVSNVVDAANESSQAHLDLNALIECTNALLLASNHPNQPLDKLPEESSYSIVGTSSTRANGELVVRLNRGDEVYIPLHGADLSIFERNELLEILETLDFGMDDNGIDVHSYDNLRARITQELALR